MMRSMSMGHMFRALSFCLMLCSVGYGWAGHYELATNDPVTGQPLAKNPFGGTLYYDAYSLAYTTYQNSYGAGMEECFYVEGVGTITTIYKWVRDKVIPDINHPEIQIDDALDNPPEEVISSESCMAVAEAYSSSGGLYAHADNGLGFAPAEGGGPDHVWANSNGTLYTKRAGGESITLTCTPNAKATSLDFDAFAMVSYSSKIFVPSVVLAGKSRFFNPDVDKFLTGQQITGSVVIPTWPAVIPDVLTATSRSWSIVQPVNDRSGIGDYKDYTHTNTLGALILNTATDAVQPTYSFYTVKNGTISLKCDIQLALPPGAHWAGGLPAFTAKSRPITSVRPEISFSPVIDGAVNLWPLAPAVPTMFAFTANPTNLVTDGQEWKNVVIAAPAPFAQAGYGCFVQLITADREIKRNTSAGFFPRFIFTSSDALDAAFPYPFSSGQWMLPSAGRFVDNPSQGLSWNAQDNGGTDWYYSRAADSFKVWAMFKPPSVDGQGTTWVPVDKYTWKWNGTAEMQNGAWVLTAKDGGWITTPADSTVHPTWTQFSPGQIILHGVW
jgi:hypothetical protein